MSKMTKEPADGTPLVDPKLAAAATLRGGRLEKVAWDPALGKVVFHFRGLSPDFLEQVFNDELKVSLKDYLSALEHVNALIAQCRVGRGR